MLSENFIYMKRHQPIKQQTMLSIIYYDLFALKSKKVRILSNLLENRITVEETTKLLNVISTSALGRDYILNKETVINDLHKVMISEESDTPIRQNCLGSLQKFSLRPIPQKKLIDLDILGWCISTLITEQVTVSDYTLEYCLALIMNLSLSSKGRDRCVKYSSSLLKVIFNYINSDSIHIRTCINGTLYSVLKKKAVKEEAKVKGLQEVLESKLSDRNEQIRKQTEYIVEELKKEEEEVVEENKESPDNKVDHDFQDEWGVDILEEAYEDDCNLNDTISASNFANFNNNTEEIRHLHNKAVEYFILKFETDNIEEIKKLNEFSSGLLKKKTNKGKNKSFSLEEYNRPLSRPITPMLNKDSVSDLPEIKLNRRKKKQSNSIDQNKETLGIKDSQLEDDAEEEENEEKEIGEMENSKDSHNSEDLGSVIENKGSVKKGKEGYTYDFSKGEKDLQKDTKAFKTKNKIARTPDQTGYN